MLRYTGRKNFATGPFQTSDKDSGAKKEPGAVAERDLKKRIGENAAEIRRLHALIHETFLHRDKTIRSRQAWEDACKQFHEAYDQLAFPDGYQGALERIAAGDPLAVEAAICFLEDRPYFFRSGYMFKAILRKVKHAPLTEDQASRFQRVLTRLELWRLIKGRRGEDP